MDCENGNIKTPLQKAVQSTISIPQNYAGDTWTPLLTLGAAVATFGFAVPAGYSLGVLNTPVKILQNWTNVTYIQERDTYFSPSQFDLLWSLIVSVFLIGGVVGGLTGAWFADRMGRKGTLIFGNVLNFASGLMFFAAKYVHSVEVFFIGRIIVGFIAGLMTTVVPMYMNEISPPSFTGLMGVLFPTGLTFGILISQILGLHFLLGTDDLWPLLISAYAWLSVLVFVSLPWLPESPKYLHQVAKLEDKAYEELSRLRNLPISTVGWELTNLSAVARRAGQEKWNLIRVLRTPRLHLPVCLVIALQAGQQFSGINVIFYYSTNIFESAGLKGDEIAYANIGTGFINFCVTTCGLWLVHSFGRRPLIMFSCLCTTLTLILLTISLKNMYYAEWIPFASVAFVLIFVFVYDLGLGPIPYFIGAELVDIGPRPIVMALGSVANWGANFLVGTGYIPLHKLLNESTFLVFAFCTFLLFLFVGRYLPETKPYVDDELTTENINPNEE